MASTLGGWYLNGSTLQYRLLDGTTLTSTVLASITGLTGLKMEEGVVKVNRGSGSWTEISENDIAVTSTGERTAANPEVATFKISDALLGTSKISVSGSTNYTAYLDLVNDSSKVHIDGTEAITYNNSAGTAVITGDLTKGFTLNKLDGTATSATYSEAKTNQTLATVTGLAKNYTASTSTAADAVSTVAFKETKKDETSGKVTEAGTITLSKVADTKNATASTISALGTGAITVNNQAIATNNGINYYLKLGETSTGDYKQQNSTDEAPYWTVKGTTATYQYYSPTGYELTNAKNEVIDREGKVYKADGTAYDSNEGDSNATKIKVTAAKTTTVATVTGLANDITTNITDEKVAGARSSVAKTRSDSIADAVGVGQARITSGDGSFVSGITISGTLTKPKYNADGKTLETDAQGNVTGTGKLSINITKAVLPTKGNVVVTPGKGFKVTANTGSDFYTDEQAKATSSNVVKNQRIWVINGNTAVYKEVDLAYYTKTADENKGTTTIACTVQKDVATLATIKGLNADWLADESHLTRNTTDTNGVITHIDGINITKTAVYTTNNSGKLVPDTRVATNVGEITLSSEVLDGMNATITKSDHYRLALQKGTVTAADSTADKTARSDVTLPAFNNYKWNLSGTTATLKGDIATAGYTLSDDSKTVTYTAAAKNQTLATVSGLKKGTELERDNDSAETEGTYRKIGNYVGANFTDGLAIDGNNALSHKTEENNKTLNRMPITISRLVMDTSKISLTSNFFKLALNKDSSLTTDSDKVNSRVYVLEKSDLYNGDEVKTDLNATVGWHGSLGSTAILKQALPAYYTTVADAAGTIKTINYTKPGTATTLATVKGLNSAINENDIEFDTTTRAIKIKNVDALTTGNVTITNPTGATEDTMYHLELETVGTTGIGEAKLSNETWEQTGTTVNYTALVTSPGYKLNADKNLITYTKEATTTPTTLATITGLRAGLAKVDPSTTQNSGSNNENGETAETDQPSWQYSGVTFDNSGTITIGKEALNGSNIAIKGSANYKLKLADSLNTTTAPDAVTRWVISGTTATYKTVIPDYYTYNASNNTITYTKTVDAKYQNETTGKDDYNSDESLKGKTIPAFGTIKGLKSNLVVSDDGQSIGYYENGTLVKEAITLATEADANGKYAITINKAGVLNGTTVSLDATAIANKYTLALSSELAKSQKPQLDGTTTWTIGRGTATLKGNVAAGYSNNSNGTQIDFSAAKNGATIATITGLNSTLTTVGDDDLKFGDDDNSNVITVANDMLSTSDVKLTTNIAILGKPYQLALGNGTKQLSDVDTDEAGKLNKWSIDKTTATYYTWRDTYYSLNNKTGEASDTITYHAAGEGLKTGDDILATVTGLASGLVTIQGDQIRGITVGKNDGNGFTADNKTGEIIQLSSNVLPTTIGSEVTVTTKATGKSYTLILDGSDSSIPTPKNALTFTVQKTGIATVDIKRATSAGFAYDGDKEYDENSNKDKTKLVYLKEDLTGDGKIGTITGLNKDGVVLNDTGTINGIDVNENNYKITLSKNVLTNRDVTFTNTSETAYSLELDSDVASSSSGPTWQAGSTSGQFVLRAGVTNGGFGSATTTDKVTTIPYVGGGNAGTEVATISGLKNTNGIVVDETAKTIIINLDNLNAKDVEFVSNTGGYTLELQTDESKDGYVAASATINTWDLTKGTATYTQKTSAGYKVDGDKIVYTPESSIVSTLNNLNQEKLFISDDKTKLVTKTEGTGENGNTTTTENDAITFANDKFTVSQEDALAHKSVKLTTKATGKDSGGNNVTANYTLELASGLQATTAPPVWNKAANSTVATYTATTAAGYTISGDNKNIVYNSDPTTATLATVNGLNKESVANSDGSAVGIETTETDESTGTETTTFTKGLEVTTKQAGDNTGVITIGNNVLNGANVTLANGDKYKFELDANVPDSDDETKIWAVSGTKATYKKVIPAYYAPDNNYRTVKYTKQADVKNGAITTISGLKSGLTPSANGSSIEGINVVTNSSTGAVDRVELTSAVLGNSKITADAVLQLSGTDILKEPTNTTGWVANGTTYTYKKYTQAYYGEDTANKAITYNAPKDITTYATISNLASGATISYTPDNNTDDTTRAKGGTIYISANQLNKKDVTLKVNSGDFKLAFAQGFDEKATIGTGTWSKKNATTAELTATKSVGYTLSEDAKSITYQKAEGTVTLATISGLKSGFELLKDSDVKTETDGTKTITLSKEQLGTANVTLKGDGYKLALARAAASETDDAGWVKAANATKATFTQQTYNGFTESADGKTLTYIKNTSKIDLATINGLSKDLTTAQMAIVYKDDQGAVLDADDAEKAVESAFDDDGTLVVIDDVNKVIHVKKEALSGKVTLGNKDGYTFALADDNDNDGIIGGDELETPKLTFNNGTMSIVNGTNDKWELSSDAKTLNWTKSDYKTLATVSGLPKTLTYTAGAENPIQGIKVDGNTIKIAEDALVKSDGTSLLSNNAKITLTNNTVDGTASNYSIELDDGLNELSTAPTAADKKKWVLSGTNLSLKEVTSAYYLNPTTSGTTQTITYVAEKVGSDLAKISGLPSGMVKQTTDGQTVYVGDDPTDAGAFAFGNSLSSAADKTVSLGTAFLNAIKDAKNAVTLTLTPNNSSGYKFADLPSSYGEPTDGTFGFDDNKSYTALKTAGKATVIKTTTEGWTEDENSHTKIIFSKAVDSVTATISGLNKNFDHSANSNDLKVSDLSDTSKTVTVGAAALTTSNVTLAIPSKGEVYNLALGSNVASTLNHSDDKDKWFTKSGTDTSTGWKNQTEWVVSGGTASYKTYDHANYYLKDNGPGKPNSIVYVAPTKGYTYATINGLNKTATTDDIDEGTEANDEIIITLGKAALGTSKVTLGVSKVNSVANANEDDVITDLNNKITAGTTKAGKYKLALATTGDDSVTASSVKSAVWDNNGTVANLTGTITKGYKLSNDQKSITYQAADSKLQVIAKVSGIKKDSQILDGDVSTLAENADGYNAALPNLKYITLKGEHLGTSNVVLTGEGYKLALDAYDATNNPNGTVITDDNADIWTNATEWVANNGTFTYKTYNKAHYIVNDTGMQVIYTVAKDDKNNTNHKTYAQITGLSKTADASALNTNNALATATKGDKDASYAITSITTANDGVITLTSDLLNKANIKLTDSKISASLKGMPVLYTGGYTLALADTLPSSLKSTASNVNATVSGTKATWSGTQGAGYLLANDEQNVTYYSAKKDKQTIATVTGLNASVTAENSNDSLSSSYDAATNVMTLTKDKLSTNVGISGTVAYNFSDFENGTITGSGSADKVSITGDGVSINAGGGNDIVEFTASSRAKGNTFLYASGNGDDVIKGFTVKDVIKVTNVVGTTSTSKKVGDETVVTYKNNIEVYTDEKNASDALVKVNNNVIRVKGVTAANLKVYDRNGYIWSSTETNEGGTPNGSFVEDTSNSNVLADDDYAMTPQNLFADDNYAMTPNLSSIVKSSTSSDYATDDLVADDATALTKQSTAVSYSDKK